MPYYPELSLNLPPVLEILDWADRQQFDAIHVSTPGPMGLCGWLVSKMLRVPLLGTYHTDFPKYLESFTRDHRITRGAASYMKWFYGHMAAVFSRSRDYRSSLRELGIHDEKLLDIRPGINTAKFSPEGRDPRIWETHQVREPRRLLYCGRVSVEKNLPLLCEIFRRLWMMRKDTALVLAGDGPYLAEMRSLMRGYPVYFLGYCNDQQLAPLYCGADLFVFPSRTDTLGQVVMEAQACGLPALVSDEGGPRELIENLHSGLVLPGSDASRWCGEIHALLDDEPRRARMAAAAIERASQLSIERTFDSFWREHVTVAEAPREAPTPASPPWSAARV